MTGTFDTITGEISKILNETSNIVSVRKSLNEYIGESFYENENATKGLLDNLEDVLTRKKILIFLLEKLVPRQVSFEEQISIIKEKIADILESEENWEESAKLLMSIPLESGYRNISNEAKAKIYIKIVRLLLEVEDSVQAEAYLHRASALMPQSDQNLTLKVCHVRILDFKRKFIEAANRYFELSFLLKDEEERYHCLREATKTAILSKVSVARTRILASLYKSENTSKVLSPSMFKLLENVLNEKLLRDDLVKEFAKTLSSHQLALLSDKSTVLDSAVREHNMLAISKLYRSVSLDRFAELVGLVEIEKAENMLVVMINEGRLKAKIDHASNMIRFAKDSSLELRNKMILRLCERIDKVIQKIQA